MLVNYLTVYHSLTLSLLQLTTDFKKYRKTLCVSFPYTCFYLWFLVSHLLSYTCYYKEDVLISWKKTFLSKTLIRQMSYPAKENSKSITATNYLLSFCFKIRSKVIFYFILLPRKIVCNPLFFCVFFLFLFWTLDRWMDICDNAR